MKTVGQDSMPPVPGNGPTTVPAVPVGPDGRAVVYDPSGNAVRLWPVDAQECVARGGYSWEKPLVSAPSEAATDEAATDEAATDET